MKNEISKITDFRKKYYLSKFQLFNDEDFITFNIVDLSTERNEIMVAIANRAKVSVITYDLKRNVPFLFRLRFMCDSINVDDFEEVNK